MSIATCKLIILILMGCSAQISEYISFVNGARPRERNSLLHFQVLLDVFALDLQFGHVELLAMRFQQVLLQIHRSLGSLVAETTPGNGVKMT